MFGSAHSGIVEMTRAANETSGNEVYAVLGGFHMSGASSRETSDVIEALKEMGVRRTGPCHCSGDTTRRMMREASGRDYLKVGVGAKIALPRLHYERKHI